MITAEDAREMIKSSEVTKPQYDDLKDKIEYRVREAIKKSENHCWVDFYIPDPVATWLSSLGYKIERHENDPRGGDFSQIMW